MTPTPSRPRSKNSIREKRKERLLGIIAKILGSIALVLMVAAVFRVVMAKLWEFPEAPIALLESGKEPPSPQEKAVEVATAQPKPASLPAESPTIAVPKPEVPKAVPVWPPSDSQASVSGIEKIDAKESEIARSLTGFFTAKSVDEKLQWVRDPERVRPLMAEFYAGHDFKPQPFKGLGWAKSVEEPGFRFGYVQALFEGSDPVSVIVEELGDGRVVVDWESSVRYGELSWREFIQAKPERPTLLRILAYRPEHISDVEREGEPRKLGVVLLKHPSDDAALEAEFDPEDPDMHPLLDQMQAGQWKDVPLTLRLCFPGAESKSNTKMARITAVEGRGWLILPQKRS